MAKRGPKRKNNNTEQGKAHQELTRKRQAAITAAGQEIGSIPPVEVVERRNASGDSFRVFCGSYFSGIFYDPWSEDHLRVIAKIERAVNEGSLFAMAMPRGSGKTVLMQIACLWAALYGKRAYVCLIAASASRSIRLLNTIKTWLETNMLLLEDFPESCKPFRALERTPQKQKTQKHLGEYTRIGYEMNKLVFPIIPDSVASGAAITCTGMEGSGIRGQQEATADGRVVRPDLVLIDDPQTRESARSPKQNTERVEILDGDILGMAGPGKKIAGLMACTVIQQDDMADEMLDQDRHPDWQGERTKLVYAFPENEELWGKYEEIRAESLRLNGDITLATAFYKKNRRAMDKGSKASWPSRYNDDELSAIQHAMNLKYRSETTFFAEYQNEPMKDAGADEQIIASDVIRRFNGYKRGTVPSGSELLTCHVDIHMRVFYYTVMAWKSDFTGSVIDYGTYPKQNRVYFTNDRPTTPLSKVYKGIKMEAYLVKGIEDMVADLVGRSYKSADGGDMKIVRLLIDRGWKPELVDDAVKRLNSAVVITSRGRGITATKKPFSEYKKERGQTLGYYWRIPATHKIELPRHLEVDTNWWKSFICTRLTCAIGTPGAMMLFGNVKTNHNLFADHMAAERFKVVESEGRVVNQWETPIGGRDNHFFDNVVGCAVAASYAGIRTGAEAKRPPKRKPVDIRAQMEKARRKRAR